MSHAKGAFLTFCQNDIFQLINEPTIKCTRNLRTRAHFDFSKRKWNSIFVCPRRGIFNVAEKFIERQRQVLQ